MFEEMSTKPLSVFVVAVSILAVGLLAAQAGFPRFATVHETTRQSFPSTESATVVGTATLSVVTGLVTSNVTGLLVSYAGIFHSGEADPVCRTALHPCELMSIQVYYLVLSSGDVYRLLFAFPPSFAEGAEVKISGILVKPSSWNVDAWTPRYHFDGDIYVQLMT